MRYAPDLFYWNWIKSLVRGRAEGGEVPKRTGYDGHRAWIRGLATDPVHAELPVYVPTVVMAGQEPVPVCQTCHVVVASTTGHTRWHVTVIGDV